MDKFRNLQDLKKLKEIVKELKENKLNNNSTEMPLNYYCINQEEIKKDMIMDENERKRIAEQTDSLKDFSILPMDTSYFKPKEKIERNKKLDYINPETYKKYYLKYNMTKKSF